MIFVAEMIVKPAAGFVPNLTAVALLRFVPTMVTVVPPAFGPEVGDTDV